MKKISLKVFICFISSPSPLLKSFLSYFLVFPRASDFCSLFVPFLRKWTFSTQSSFICPQHGIELNYGRLIGSTLNPIEKRAKVLFKAILWNHLPPLLLPSSAQTVLPPYSTSPITLKSNLNEVESWNVGEIATKCRIKQLTNTRVYVIINHSNDFWASSFLHQVLSFLLEIVYFKKTWIRYNSSSSISNWKC